jgi:hypothetical protein
MIAHFDMITGQPLNDVQEADQADTATPDVVAPSLRLLTVQESIGAGHTAARLPMVIAGLPLGRLLDKWQ